MGSKHLYSLKKQARALAPIIGDVDHNRFLVGTSSLRKTNEIHVVELDEDGIEVTCVGVCEHPTEVWAISPSLVDHGTLFTTGNSGTAFECTLWQLPEFGAEGMEGPKDTSHSVPMTTLGVIPITAKRVNNVLWDPFKNGTAVLTCEDRSLGLWSLDADGSIKETGRVWTDDRALLSRACWDPHHQQQVATLAGNHFKAWDIRSSKAAHFIDNVHHSRTFDVDYNPNLPNQLVTAGDDQMVKFWDMRNTATPMKCIAGHSHHVTRVVFNRYHDQLLLSTSTDNSVCLWHVPSMSAGTVNPEQDAGATKDGLSMRSSAHEECVYDAAWSACDGWVYASLSYDGRLVIDTVSPEVKYKILL